MPNELLIKGGHVVTMDPVLGDQPDSDVLVRDGSIVEIRPGLETSVPDAKVIEAKGRLVIPALSTLTATCGRERSAGSPPRQQGPATGLLCSPG